MNKLIFIMYALSIFLMSCSDEPTTSSNGTEEELQPTYLNIYTNILSRRCVSSGCHISTHDFLDMSTASIAYNNLINVPSSESLDYIEPNEPDNSYLYLKIIGSAGTRMPLNRSPLSESQISSIREWIAAGALNN